MGLQLEGGAGRPGRGGAAVARLPGGRQEPALVCSLGPLHLLPLQGLRPGLQAAGTSTGESVCPPAGSGPGDAGLGRPSCGREPCQKVLGALLR